MFADYERLVLQDYQRKKSANLLPFGLMHTTQAKLKKECVRLSKVKIHGKDEKVIRDFCEDWDPAKTCFEILHKYDVDKFKALSNFMKGNTESTDERNIQLLAWLINFPHRPFDFSKDYSVFTEMGAILDRSEPEGNPHGDSSLTPADQQPKSLPGLDEDPNRSSVAFRENSPQTYSATKKSKFRTIVAIAGGLLAAFIVTSSIKDELQGKAHNEQTVSPNRSLPPKTRTYLNGPRGGCYYINSNGNKVYVDRSFCPL